MEFIGMEPVVGMQNHKDIKQLSLFLTDAIVVNLQDCTRAEN